VPIGSSHVRLSWLRLLGVVAGVLVRPRARRRARTREQDCVPPLFMALVRLHDSVLWWPDKFVQCYERLAPYPACLPVDGRRRGRRLGRAAKATTKGQSCLFLPGGRRRARPARSAGRRGPRLVSTAALPLCLINSLSWLRAP
jgi:hypothetical protein